ncbi:MAG: hypothetical protein ACPGPR_10080 [Paracoccaceae bacterium]
MTFRLSPVALDIWMTQDISAWSEPKIRVVPLQSSDARRSDFSCLIWSFRSWKD